MSSTSWHQNVLDYWFEELSRKDWFMSSKLLDDTITNRFSAIHKQITNQTELADNTNPSMVLAAVIVLDQFSRNMFRGTPQAFSSDAQALRFANTAIDRELHKSMSDDQKQFLYMPFMHSENIADQNISVTYFDELGRSEHAIEHREVIERFGRFPHRNALLGRQSTDDEINYLKDAKRYGQ